jgi:hypothetical protein
MAESIFRKESLDRVSSPEQLYDYIKVSNPGIWIVLSAILLLLAAGAFWIATASIPTTVSVNAVEESPGRYVSYLPYGIALDITAGMNALVGGKQGKVIRVAETPESRQEAARALRSDYKAYALGLTDWNIRVEIQAPAVQNPAGVTAVTITKASVRPFSFLFN